MDVIWIDSLDQAAGGGRIKEQFRCGALACDSYETATVSTAQIIGKNWIVIVGAFA
jgi:hypothetical protein